MTLKSRAMAAILSGCLAGGLAGVGVLALMPPDKLPEALNAPSSEPYWMTVPPCEDANGPMDVCVMFDEGVWTFYPNGTNSHGTVLSKSEITISDLYIRVNLENIK